MKYLSLTINGTPIPVPTSVQHFNDISLDKLVQFAVSIIFTLAIILALGYLIYGAVQWIISEGDKQKVQTARQAIIYSIVGLVIIFMSFFIISLISHFFGVNLLTPPALQRNEPT
jgi:TRAP-type C4-dicarboxylate transport system permease small subunit